MKTFIISITMATGEYYLYLCNLGNRDVYRDNVPSQFQNRITPPISLDANTDYEVGLVNCLYPRKYYGISKLDHECRIEVWVKPHHGEQSPYMLLTFLPMTNIKKGDTKFIVDNINAELGMQLKQTLETEYEGYFKDGGEFLVYDKQLRRVELVIRKGTCGSNGHFCAVSFTFGSRIAQCLGFDENKRYVVYTSSDKLTEAYSRYRAPFPPRPDAGVDFAIVYTDCVTPTHYAGQLVNILEMITLEGAGDKDFHKVVYKPLNKTLIDTISIKVVDQRGRRIYFGEEQTMTALIHIRPK